MPEERKLIKVYLDNMNKSGWFDPEGYDVKELIILLKQACEGLDDCVLDRDTKTLYYGGEAEERFFIRGYRDYTPEEIRQNKERVAMEKEAARKRKIKQEEREYNEYLKLKEKFENE